MAGHAAIAAGGAPRRPRPVRGGRGPFCGPRPMTAERQVLVEAELPGHGNGPDPGQPATGPPPGRSGRGRAGHRLLPRRPPSRPGRSGRAPRAISTTCSSIGIPGSRLLTSEVDRVLRQRASVLRQAGNRLDADIVATLDVWDDRLATAGSELADAREALVVELAPLVSEAYGHLAGSSEPVTLSYRRSWDGDLSDALCGPAGRGPATPGHLGRPPSRRARDQRGPRPGPDPRLAGRATVRGSGPAPGHARIAPAGTRPNRPFSSSTTCSPSSTPAARRASSSNCRPARSC